MNRQRWQITGTLFLLAFITIVDRVCISAAKNDVARDLTISDAQFGFVFGAFAIGYALFMTPSGWAADRLGPRRFLTLIVCLWSLLTVSTGFVHTFGALVIIRLLFGGAEAGAFPTATRAIYNWLPIQNRGFALGLLNTGSRLGAAFGLAVTSLGITRIGWRASFVVLGMAGLGWTTGWYLWFRDRPQQNTPLPAGESAAPGSPLVSFNSALLLLQYFASNFTFFLCFTWLLPYLRSRFGLSAHEAGWYAGVPLYFGAAATWTSGLTVDWLYRKERAAWSRRAPAIAGFMLAAVTLVAAGYVTGPRIFVLLFAITTFGVDFTLSPSWTTCSDVAGSRTGTLAGAMNTLGSAGSFASSILFPWLLQITHSVKSYFFLAALLNLMAVLCWWKLRIAPVTASRPIQSPNTVLSDAARS